VSYFKEVLADLRNLYARQPVRINAFLASAVVFAFAKAGIVPQTDVLIALTYAVPILLSGEFAHQKVTPVTPEASAQPEAPTA
jgi:hypothetical protein